MRFGILAIEALMWRRDAAERDGDQTLVAALDEAARQPMGNSGIAVHAHVNHGRWIVECPSCGGAQLATPTDPRFMCDVCLNAAVDGRWRPVFWPDDVDAIGRELERRPAVDNQHWSPGETIADLREQHVAADLLDHLASDEYREAFNDHKAPHTHSWPKKLPDAEYVECPECGLVLPVQLVHDDPHNESEV